jgi:hypothetical protein
MRRWVSSMALMFGVLAVVAVAMPASAQEVTRSVKITRDSTIGGKQIAKGGYEIKFVEGKDGELVLMKGKQEVSKVNYKITKLTQPAVGDAVAYMTAADGSFIVKRLEFKGKTEAIVLE